MNRGKKYKCPTLVLALTRYVNFEDVIIRDKDKNILGYINNEDITKIKTELYYKEVEVFKSCKLSTKPGREGKEIIIITLLN